MVIQRPSHNESDSHLVRKWREAITRSLNELAASGGGGGLTQEQIQDMLSTFLVAGTNVSLSYNDAGDTLTINASGVSDGDKGDITVSSSGAVFTIDNGVVTKAKIAADLDAYIIAMAIAL